MEATDLFRGRIGPQQPPAMLATRLPWSAINAGLTPKFERRDRAGPLVEVHDMLGLTTARVGACCGIAGRPRMPIWIRSSRLCFKHRFNLSDQDASPVS